MSGQTAWTEARIGECVQSIEKVVEKHRTENRSEHFTSVAPEEVKRKLSRMN